MLDRLYVKQLARPIEELGIRPPNANIQEWSELDRRCLGYIRDYVDVRVIQHVENAITTYGCWKKLQGLYERKTAGHKVSLVRQLGKLRFTDGNSLTEHLNQVEHIFNQLNSMGIDFNDEVQALWILRSLLDSWETFSVSLSASAPDGTISKELGDFGEARMGNNGASKIIAMGDVHIKTDLGYTLILKDVRHIHDFRMSLVSSGRLDDDGYSYFFGQGQ
ncbi:hypothetical protein LIER_18800 [Lithospermum erythrorhizon]|uniref:Retrovirus-related Pol polyprotein from transposon TNT 1-94-like beta-barrel domain-containing protein n=1 Tax=Lithospermum erythrorhizon TaxID=34254 RepID=A0AAV3QI46_LITER